MWNWGDGPDGWGWFWMGVMMLIVWLPLLVILLWALRRFGQPSRGNEPPSNQLPPEPGAREIARRAYARGETAEPVFEATEAGEYELSARCPNIASRDDRAIDRRVSA